MTKRKGIDMLRIFLARLVLKCAEGASTGRRLEKLRMPYEAPHLTDNAANIREFPD